MTILLNNNFDGGVTGSQITTANSGVNPADNAFTYVGQSNTGTCQYGNVAALGLNRSTAEYVMAMASGATSSATAYVGYNATFLSTLTTYWTRFYVNFSSLLANSTADTCLFSSYHTSGLPGVTIFLSCTPAPPFQLYIWNGYSSTFSQMTTAIVAGVWNRIEFTATLGTSTGSASMSLYAGSNADGVTPDETVTQSAQNYGTTTINSASIGMDYGWQTNTPTVYFSNWQINNTGYPGPAPFRPGAGCPGILTNPIAIHSDVC